MPLTSFEAYSAFAAVSVSMDPAGFGAVVSGFAVALRMLKLGAAVLDVKALDAVGFAVALGAAVLDVKALDAVGFAVAVAPEKPKLGAAVLDVEALDAVGFAVAPEKLKLGAAVLDVEALDAVGFAVAPEKPKLGAAVLDAKALDAVGFAVAPEKPKLGAAVLDAKALDAVGFAVAPEKLKLGAAVLDVAALDAVGFAVAPEKLKLGAAELDAATSGALRKLKLAVGAVEVPVLLGVVVTAVVAVGAVAPKPDELRLNVGKLEDEPLELPNDGKVDKELVEGADNPLGNPLELPPKDNDAAGALPENDCGTNVPLVAPIETADVESKGLWINS
eukprot:gene24620-33089_t